MLILIATVGTGPGSGCRAAAATEFFAKVPATALTAAGPRVRRALRDHRAPGRTCHERSARVNVLGLQVSIPSRRLTWLAAGSNAVP